MAQKEDNLIKLKKQLKDKCIGNIYLLFGEEDYVKELYLKRLCDMVPDDGFGDFNRIFIEGRQANTDRIDDALNSFPMMAEKKLVVIKDSGVFKSAPPEIKEFWQDRISHLPDFVLLIFDEKEVDRRSAVYKAISDVGLAVEFKFLKDYEISSWIMREVHDNKKSISKESAEFLVSMCDDGLRNVKNELTKLFNYCGDEIFKSDIEKVVSKPLGIVVFEITDAIMDKNGDRAMKVILTLKENKESAFNILYLLSSAFDKMLLCKLMLEEGASYDAISARLKLAPFITRKYIDGAKGFTKKFLIERVCKTAECDLAVKQGEMDEWTALLQYVFECVKK